MELYNSLIGETRELLRDLPQKTWDYSPRDAWADNGSSELVLQKDAAYELGASGKGSANFVLFTSDPALVAKDQTILCGKDLKEIKGTEYDTFYLMEKNAKAAHKPWLYVSCGTKDFLFAQHKAFVPALRKNGWEVMSHEEPDAVHEWGFWDEQIKAFIQLIYTKEETDRD